MAAFAPGSMPGTGATVRSTTKEASAFSQSTGFPASCFAIGSKAGISLRNSPYCNVILLRIVLAAVSCLLEACHTGTTLCASTCTQLTPALPRVAATSAVQAFGTRKGDMSQTTAPTPRCSQRPKIDFACEPYSQSSNSNGILSSRSSVSTSRRPRNMKSNCLIVASRNLGTKQKATSNWPPAALARSRAWSNAQLSCTRWSRDIQ
mmetsp:Transcript_67272/g.217147  ORF Transcript_67272/g.217147 Transcript_67272/m.217147 type:complete len:206 (+) Transcript_67272:858-1475(+)